MIEQITNPSGRGAAGLVEFGKWTLPPAGRLT